MKATKLYILLFSGLSMVFSSCGASNKAVVSLSTDSTATIKVGQKAQFAIQSNPSTGYTWNWVNKDDSQLELVDTEVEETQSKPMMIGAPSKVVYTFKAKKEGEGTVEMHLFRPWLGDSSTVEKSIYRFKVVKK